MRRWLAPLRFRYLPLAIGASVLLVPWFYLSCNLTIGRLIPVLHFENWAAIAGLVVEETPKFSLNAILSGTYQQWIARGIGRLSPVFSPAVQWKGQLYYSLLSTSGTNRVVVGSQRQLLELPYLIEYCSRDLAGLRTKGEDWATWLRQMQDFFEACGQQFVYVITPSKVAQNPQIIPDGYDCPAHVRDRAEKLKVYDEILMRHGIRFVGTASYLADAGKDYPIGMFPRGGTHWNSLGAALGTQRVIEAINAQQRGPLLATFSFTWRVSYTPLGTDLDLLALLNLRYPDANYPVPELTYRSARPPTGCHRIAITEVGASFLLSINRTLGNLACPPDITYWFYWSLKRFHYVGDQLQELPVEAQGRRQSLLEAQVIIFEENESSAPGSYLGYLMMQDVAALTSTDAALAKPQPASPSPPPR